MIYVILGGILLLLAAPLVLTASLLSYFTGVGLIAAIVIVLIVKSIFKVATTTLVQIFLFLCIVWLILGYLY